MKWTKRLKWIRLSKIIIPIALAISLVFAGFTVYGHEAENFVVRIDSGSDIKLSLSAYDDLRDQADRLIFPVEGFYTDTTYVPDTGLLYESDRMNYHNLPDDIARHEGLHPVYSGPNTIEFYSVSFWLINNSKRAVDVDITLTIDSRVYGKNYGSVHMEEAVRIMLIENKPLLSDETYTVYKKPESSYEYDRTDNRCDYWTPEYGESELSERVAYSNVVPFTDSDTVFRRTAESGLGIASMEPGAAFRFTVVIWLEGWDRECINHITHESLKMSMNFKGW